MDWQKWIIRGLVVAILGGLATVGGLYALWTSPQAIRQLVQEKLGVRFIRVGVQVGSARLRLLGGILVRDLRLDRSEGLDRRDFLYVPTAVIYHDKEQVLDGKVALRRVELTQPQIRIVRQRDGRINVSGILGPVDLTERMPTLVLRQGILVYEDHTVSTSPMLEIRDLQLTMINDPLPILKIEGSGKTDVLGPIHFKASVPRATLAASVEINFPTIPVGKELVQRIERYSPRAGTHLTRLTGLGNIHIKLKVPENADDPITHDLHAEFNHGRCVHSQIPLPLDNIQGVVRLVNGMIPEAKLTANHGKAKLQARIADFKLPEESLTPASLEQLTRECDLSVEQLDVNDDVLAALPPDLHYLKEDFSPSGPINIAFRYRRGEGPSREMAWTLEPQGMSGRFIDFPYPLKEVRGRIWIDTSRIPLRNIHLDLSGLAGERPATLHGTIKGEKKTGAVHLEIRGKDIVLDDNLMRAVPPRVRKVANQFLPASSRLHGLANYPMGSGDVEATIHRQTGNTRVEKSFIITFRKCAVLYDQFPYPLENVSGILKIYPDHWEAHNFRGSHAGGELFVEGRSYPLTERGSGPTNEHDIPTPESVHIKIRGKEILLDKEFEQALVPASGQERKDLQAAWRRLRLAGRLSFAAEVVDHPGQPQDIDVSVDVHGCAMKPDFFDYAIDQLSGSVRYARSKLYLRDMKARHGQAALSMASGLIQLGQDGGYSVWLKGISGKNVLPDQDLRSAVPEGVRNIMESLRLTKPIDLACSLTLVSPPGPNRSSEVWWEGAIGLNQCTLKTGVEIQEATGKIFCKGYHDGRKLRGANGQIKLDRASVLGQPLTNLFARMDVEPSTPDILRIRDVRADLFGGKIAGEARLETSPLFRYDVLLEAIGIQLDLIGRHNLGEANAKAQLQGAARAAIHLVGEGSDLLNLKGNGRIDVPNGKMGQLPVLLDLVKAFGLRVPDRTAFEQAQMTFAIEGPQIQVRQLDLYGNAISLRGQGALDLDGSNINLDFSATPGRMTQILPTGMDLIPQAISSQFLKIKMRGKLGKGQDMKFDKELIPGVVEPLRRAMGGS